MRPEESNDASSFLNPRAGSRWFSALEDRLHGTPFHPGVLAGSHAKRWAATQGSELPGGHWARSLLQISSSAPGRNEVLRRGDDASTLELNLTWDGAAPVVRCPEEGQATPTSEEEAHLREAVKTFCNAGLGSFVEFFVDPRFKANYDRLADKDGWIDKAYLTYLGVKEAHDAISAEEDMLAQSVNHFSDYPLVVANFGNRLPESFTPERFPNLVVMKGRSTMSAPSPFWKSFNFGKMTAMLFTKVRTGAALDADQWLNSGVDYMLKRAAEETTKDYPFPIMPVHWLSRDPEDTQPELHGQHFPFSFASKEAPKRTMRWGHAHPTWTHFALPFLAKWTSFALSPQTTNAPQWLTDQAKISLEDEDLMNFALWAEGATKQWCKFDIAFPWEFEQYVEQAANIVTWPDSKWYPKGIPFMFFSAHGAKDADRSYSTLSKLWHPGDDNRKVLHFDGKWFGSVSDLEAYDPNLSCIA